MNDAIKVPILDKSGSVVAYATVNAADAPFVSPYTWRLLKAKSGKRYAIRASGKRGVYILMHRAIMSPPGDMEVDHLDGDGLNNLRENMRIVTHAQNLQNRCSAATSTSRFRGVSWNAQRQRWHARVKLNGHVYDLGRFKDELDAARVVEAWRREHMPFSVELVA